jgi:hypothetical protein
MGKEDCIENPVKKGYRSLWEILKALFGLPLGRRALLTFRPLMDH